MVVREAKGTGAVEFWPEISEARVVVVSVVSAVVEVATFSDSSLSLYHFWKLASRMSSL